MKLIYLNLTDGWLLRLNVVHFVGIIVSSGGMVQVLATTGIIYTVTDTAESIEEQLLKLI